MIGRDFLLGLVAVLLLIGINAFFVTAEFSIVSVRRSRISQLVEAGDIQARTVQSLQQSIERLLSTTQLGITLSSLALGWIGEKTVAVLVARAIQNLPLSQPITYSIAHSFAVPIAFLSIVYLQIVLGELCPKSVALIYSEELARFFAPPSLAIARIFNPFIWILDRSTRWILKLVGIQHARGGWYNRVTPEELQLIITTEKESSGLEAEERELLKNIFEFRDVIAVEVMIPRISISAIPSTATLELVLNQVASTGHSRYPVIGDSLDNIEGAIDFKDLALGLARGEIRLDTAIHPWIKPVHFVPESTFISELLALMQRSNQKMAIVVDEFGGTAGLVTIQDLIAEIIGDRSEETNPDDVPFQILNDRTFLVQAQMNLEEVNEWLDLDLPLADEYQTLGGFLLYQWQKIPTQGESLFYNDLELTVISATGPRLNKIRIYKLDYSPKEEDLESGLTNSSDSISETATIDKNNQSENQSR
jgi:CBS domain containing-hemolysin-like protein